MKKEWKKIERAAFSDCKELKKVSIPASVTEMGEDVLRVLMRRLSLLCSRKVMRRVMPREMALLM